jgi:hypothetical protein
MNFAIIENYWIYNFIEYNQVPMNFRSLNSICIEFEIIWKEILKIYCCTGSYPQSQPGPASLSAHEWRKQGKNSSLVHQWHTSDSGWWPVALWLGRRLTRWEPNLGCWRLRCPPEEAGDDEVHGSGEGVDSRADKWLPIVTWGSERIEVSHRGLRYCWHIRGTTEYGWHQWVPHNGGGGRCWGCSRAGERQLELEGVATPLAEDRGVTHWLGW